MDTLDPVICTIRLSSVERLSSFGGYFVIYTKVLLDCPLLRSLSSFGGSTVLQRDIKKVSIFFFFFGGGGGFWVFNP